MRSRALSPCRASSARAVRAASAGECPSRTRLRTVSADVLRRASRWKIADPSQVEDDGNYYVEFAFRLNTSLLPRPMQIGIGGETAWSLSAERTQQLE